MQKSLWPCCLTETSDTPAVTVSLTADWAWVAKVGDAYVLGPLTGEHWLFYDALYLKVPPVALNHLCTFLKLNSSHFPETSWNFAELVIARLTATFWFIYFFWAGLEHRLLYKRCTMGLPTTRQAVWAGNYVSTGSLPQVENHGESLKFVRLISYVKRGRLLGTWRFYHWCYDVWSTKGCAAGTRGLDVWVDSSVWVYAFGKVFHTSEPEGSRAAAEAMTKQSGLAHIAEFMSAEAQMSVHCRIQPIVKCEGINFVNRAVILWGMQ